MEMETFFAQLFGLYFLIVGAVVLVRGKSLMPAVSGLASNRSLTMTLGIFELGAGLALIIAYPTISSSVSGILSLIGYVMAIEGLTYLASSSRFIQKMIRTFNRKEWYVAGGLLSIGLGAYLANAGFGLGLF